MFDLVLIIFILASVLAVILDSVQSIRLKYHDVLMWVEWIITASFTLEYITRIWVSPKRFSYIFGFYGLIDFLAIVPTYLTILISGAMGFAVIRGLRLLRIFRILKITRYSSEGSIIIDALKASRVKILVFLFAVLTIILIIGTLMYLVEGEVNGFTSIPVSIYWTVVTLTTVGYGDITPLTPLGKFIAGFVMILGYGIIAVPTSIITYELSTKVSSGRKQAECPYCGSAGHEKGARYCKDCGKQL